MATANVPFNLIGGQDRGTISYRSFGQSFYELRGFRQSRTELGKIEQLPRFISVTRTARDYYNAGTVTEDASTKIIGSWRLNFFTQQTASTSGGTSIPIFYQSTVPTGTGLIKGCYMQVNSVAGLALTLGNTVDVQIEVSGSSFQWRKNGGAWTTAVPITTTGVSIDSGNATIYFLASSGFNNGDLWSFQRTDRMLDTSGATALVDAISSVVYENQLYFTNANYRIMVFDPVVGYIRSLGYRPIYGYQLKIFFDHLFVCNALKDTIVTGSGVSSSFAVYNSDLNDLDAFFSTDTNEADEFSFPEAGPGQDSTTITSPWRFGMAVINNLLYVITPYGVKFTSYLGLPDVFSFQDHSAFRLSVFLCKGDAVIQSDNGAYVIREDGPWFFDGTTFSHVGRALALNGELAPTTKLVYSKFGMYDYDNREFHMFLESAGSSREVYTFQENYKLWHKRSVAFLRTVNCMFIYTSSTVTNRLSFGASNLTWYNEDQDFSGTPVGDALDGQAYAAPNVIFQVYNDRDFSTVKETESEYIQAQVRTAGANYDTGIAATIVPFYRISDQGRVGTTTVSSTLVWTSASVDGLVSFPRVAFRGIAFGLRAVGATGKPAGIIDITAFSPRIHNIAEPTPTR